MSTRTKKITAFVTPEAHQFWGEWAAANHRSRNSLLEALPHAWKEGRLLWLDKPTLDALVGAVEDRIVLRAERVTRKTVREVLHEQGFVLTQYDK